METTTRMTLEQFISQNSLEIKVVRVPANTDTPKGWDKDARHFCVTLLSKITFRFMSLCYSQGSAHTKIPTCADILDYLVSECGGEIENFENWCRDFGLSTDSIKASNTFEAIRKHSRDLMILLGKDAYVDLQNCERL